MKLVTTIRVYLPSGRQLVYQEGKHGVIEIDVDQDTAFVVFEDETAKTFIRMPIEVETKLVEV